MASKKEMKRKAAMSLKHLLQSASCVFELREIFIPHHPQFAEFFDYVITTMGILAEQLKKVFTIAWGHFPDDLDTWLH